MTLQHTVYYKFSIKIRKFNAIYHLRFRTSELVALMAISTTLFLFLHTRELSSKLKEMEGNGRISAEYISNQLISGKYRRSLLLNYLQLDRYLGTILIKLTSH